MQLQYNVLDDEDSATAVLLLVGYGVLDIGCIILFYFIIIFVGRLSPDGLPGHNIRPFATAASHWSVDCVIRRVNHRSTLRPPSCDKSPPTDDNSDTLDAPLHYTVVARRLHVNILYIQIHIDEYTTSWYKEKIAYSSAVKKKNGVLFRVYSRLYYYIMYLYIGTGKVNNLQNIL